MEPLNTFFVVVLFIVGIVVLVTVLKTLFTVRTYTAGVVERFGKFNRIVRPGLHVLVPYAERVYFVDLQVKQAEAEAESKALQGKGIAAERQAIIDGLRASIEHFRESVPGSTSEDVMALVLLTQYFDTLRDIGTRSGSNTIFLPNSPGAANDFMTQILAGLRGNSGLSTHP